MSQVDGLGNPVDFILTGGEVHDSVSADTLLNGKSADFVVADKAYDTNAILDRIAQKMLLSFYPIICIASGNYQKRYRFLDALAVN